MKVIRDDDVFPQCKQEDVFVYMDSGVHIPLWGMGVLSF